MFLYLLIAFSSANIKIGLITSKYTPESLKSSLSANLPGVTLQVEEYLRLTSPIELLWTDIDFDSETDETKWTIPNLFLDNSVQVMLDAAFFIRYSNFLSIHCLNQGLLHIVISRPIYLDQGELAYSNTLFAETSYNIEASVMLDLINYFGWINLGIIHDNEINNSQMANTIRDLVQSPLTVFDHVILDDADTLNTANIAYRLRSTTKDSGAKVLIVMAKAKITAQVLRAADLNVMGGVGFAWILNSDAMDHIGEVIRDSFVELSSKEFSVLKSGAIGIRAIDAQHNSNDPMASYLAILTLLAKAISTLGDPSGPELKEYLLSNQSPGNLPYPLHFDSSGFKKISYKIYNLHNFAELEIGSWNAYTQEISIKDYAKIMWPGFTHSAPNDTIPIIQIGLLYPGHDNKGEVYTLGVNVKKGFDLAISEINSDPSALKGYQIQPIYTDTFLLPELAETNLGSLAPFNIIGYVGPSNLELCKAYFTAQTYNDDQKPMITYLGSTTTLSDSNNYPNILQIIQPDGLQAVALTLFIQLQTWSEIGVIYTDDEFGLGVYESFLANIGTLEVTITNPENKRIISFGLDKDNEQITEKTKQSVEEVLSEIVKKQIKVIVYLGNPKAGPELAKVGYKKELRGSEYSWLGTLWLTSDTMSDIDKYYKSDKTDILDLLEGAIGIDYRGVQGDVGSVFEANYFKAYGEEYSTESMLAYDAVYTFSNVISGIIGRGDNYNSGQELINSLRSTDLTGASGKIKFSEGSNGRSAYGYNIVNFKDGKAVEVRQYDPLDPNLFITLNNETIVWAGGKSSAPDSTWPVYYDCPFASHMSRLSPKGLGVIISIGSFLFFLTLILSFYSYKKWKQLEIKPITSTVIRSWKDTLVQVQIGIEFFQFIAIAPAFSSLEIVIKATSNIFMLDIMKVASTNKSDYWIMLVAVCVLCYIWFILVLIIMLNGEHWLKKIPFMRRIVSILNSVFLPFFGNTFFLPALALLLDMFVCDHRAQGHDYVWRDCYMKCWEGDHSKYAIMSGIAILCYEPVAAYSRPLWQQSRSGLMLKIQPFFLLLKTCFQILLIAIGKSLQSSSPIAHGVVFTIIISIFTGLIYKLKPFNYNRCNLWEFSSMVAVSYLSFLATLSYVRNPTHIGWFIALAIGWGIIGGVSLYVQKKHMPNLLVPPSGNRIKKKVYDIISLKNKGQYDNDLDKSRIPFPNEEIKNSEEDENQVYVKQEEHVENFGERDQGAEEVKEEEEEAEVVHVVSGRKEEENLADMEFVKKLTLTRVQNLD